MSVAPSQLPGRHERHYRRRLDNPLFGDRAQVSDDAALLEAQRLDHDELLAFLGELRETVQHAVDLRPNEGSETILALKERLERLYERSALLADDQRANRGAIGDLIEVIMGNVRRSAGADPLALQELAREEAARTAHFELLQSPLVADLLDPDSPIAADELAATLLSAPTAELEAALGLFDHGQLVRIHADAERCLALCAAPPPDAAARLAHIGTAVRDTRSVH